MFWKVISLKRLALAAVGLSVAGLWWAPPSAARPPTGVKYSITRAENPEKKKEALILPYAFSAESLGVTAGAGAGAKGYGQDQLLVAGTVFASSEKAVGVFLGAWDYRPPAARRLFLSAMAFAAHLPYQRAYTALAFEPGKPRPGGNDSDEEDFVETPGQDNWLDFRVDYVLPLGAGAGRNGLLDYQLAGGMRTSPPSGGRRWNPLTGGVTLITLRQYNRFQSFETQVADFERSIHPVEVGVLYDNTDFAPNPSFGSSQYLSYTQDFEWFGSKERWNFIQLEASKYFTLGASSRARQRVVALNFWTGHSPGWKEGTDRDGNIVLRNVPPHYEGATLGGFFRMRGYPQQRFNDRSVIYVAGEYRYTPLWNPLGRVSWLQFLKMDWWQFALFAEGGRVANAYDGELLQDWKLDAGAGVRAMVAGAVVRLDIGVSDEGINGWIMLGQPF